MKTINKDKTITQFSPNMDAVENVRLNEVFCLKTEDCYGGQVLDETIIREDLDMGRFNQATGPVFVENVEPGDWVKVDIIDIQLGGDGVLMVSPGLGVLGERIKSSTTKFSKIDFHSNVAKLPGGFKVPITPQIGVIGAATVSETVGTESPGVHGGNLDTKIITKGASFLVQAAQPGLLIAVGDLHAMQGDGEMGGTGIEIKGCVTLKANKVPHNGKLPAVITKEGIDILSSGKDIEKAAESAFNEAVFLFEKWHKVEWDIAYRTCSIVGDIKISQMVNPLKTVRFHIPKSFCDKGFWL